mgnify:CR=1 FL=1
MKNFCVYIHTFPNKKVYIGITCQKPKWRWQNGNGYKFNVKLSNAIKKYGWNNISHDIIFSGLNEKEAKQKEVYLISKFNSKSKYALS